MQFWFYKPHYTLICYFPHLVMTLTGKNKKILKKYEIALL